MKFFYVYIFILCVVILISSVFSLRNSFKSQEGMDLMNGDFILLGDSILQNNNYVKEGQTVEDKLKRKTNLNVYNYAKDNSTIVDVYEQINNIPNELNQESTILFLSAGGNDILMNYEYDNGDTIKTRDLEVMLNAYKKLVESIQTKMNQSKIVLLDIYYPTNIKYKQFRPVLEKWNKMLQIYANKNGNKVLKVSELLMQPEDFSLSIEPSEAGGEKIANEIISKFV
jgi:hypothetical protein